MNSKLSIYLLLVSFVSLTSCQVQEETKRAAQVVQPANIEGFTNSTAIEKVDTLVVKGAPNHITRNILEDRNGDIWLATFGGIIRYDGETFMNVTEGVSDHRFFSIVEDSEDRLWFGSIGGGVYSYDGTSFQQLTTTDGLIDNEVNCIFEDQEGSIWFGANKGVSRYDGQAFQSYHLDKDTMITVDGNLNRLEKIRKQASRPPYEVNSIIEVSSDELWFATRGNTFRYDGTTFTTVLHEGKPFKNIRHLLVDTKGNIWLGGNPGLWRYDGTTFSNITRGFVGYIYEDSRGNIWTSSEHSSQAGWALSRYDVLSLNKKQPVATPIRTGEGMFFGITEDSGGMIWAGTLNGVVRYDGKTVTRFINKQN